VLAFLEKLLARQRHTFQACQRFYLGIAGIEPYIVDLARLPFVVSTLSFRLELFETLYLSQCLLDLLHFELTLVLVVT
jgi:hypothetical protein